MRIIRSIRSMHALARRLRSRGSSIAFVPTMGCLHAGHMSLVGHARRAAGRAGRVIVSIYVNPAQFGPAEDFSRYPRDLAADARLCRAAGVDFIFAPSDTEMYPREKGRRFSTQVVEEALSGVLEGISRPEHFRGVTTVVAKLFHIVQPDVAVFGMKDFQQQAIIGRMIEDLNFPVRMVAAPTVRESDGLALSSRNRYLSEEERREATLLYAALELARKRVAGARAGLPVARLKAELNRLLSSGRSTRVDYVEFFHPQTLEPVRTVRPGTHLALAVFVGATRLIDNALL